MIRQFLIGPMQNFGYLIADEVTRSAAIVDPSFDGRRLAEEARRRGFVVAWVLLTHGHPDHAHDAPRLVRETGAKLAAHRLCGLDIDEPLADGRVLRIGGLDLRVLHTPGHTPDSCCFVVDGGVLTGDTLFVGECGRVDLPGSDVRAMHHSLLTVLRGLEDDLIVYPGHDYGPSPTSTIGREKRENYTLRPRTLAEFERFMREP